METLNEQKVRIGSALLAVGTVLVLAHGFGLSSLPLVAITVGTLVLAVGTLLFGTANSGRPV